MGETRRDDSVNRSPVEEDRRPPNPPEKTSPNLRIGRLAGPHGLRGALRLNLDNPDSETLASIDEIQLELSGKVRRYRVTAFSKPGRGTARLQLEGVEDRNAAEELKGAVVTVDADRIPPPGPSEFYYFQVIGCEVFATDGERLGAVEEAFFTGAHDVWVVRQRDREIMIPVIEDVVREMDLEGRRITVQMPEERID